MVKKELSNISKDMEESKDLVLLMCRLERDILELVMGDSQLVVYKGIKKGIEDFGVEAFNNKMEAIKVINEIEDDRERFILVERYINKRNWGGIIEDMFYSERRVYEIHKEALKSYEKIKRNQNK